MGERQIGPQGPVILRLARGPVHSLGIGHHAPVDQDGLAVNRHDIRRRWQMQRSGQNRATGVLFQPVLDGVQLILQRRRGRRPGIGIQFGERHRSTRMIRIPGYRCRRLVIAPADQRLCEQGRRIGAKGILQRGKLLYRGLPVHHHAIGKIQSGLCQKMIGHKVPTNSSAAPERAPVERPGEIWIFGAAFPRVYRCNAIKTFTSTGAQIACHYGVERIEYAGLSINRS